MVFAGMLGSSFKTPGYNYLLFKFKPFNSEQSYGTQFVEIMLVSNEGRISNSDLTKSEYMDLSSSGVFFVKPREGTGADYNILMNGNAQRLEYNTFYWRNNNPEGIFFYLKLKKPLTSVKGIRTWHYNANNLVNPILYGSYTDPELFQDIQDVSNYDVLIDKNNGIGVWEFGAIDQNPADFTLSAAMQNLYP